MLKVGQRVENIQERCFECSGFVRFGKISEILRNGRIEITDSNGRRSCYGDEKEYKAMGGELEEVE